MPYDVYGNPVPARLREPFEARAEVVRWTERLGSLFAELAFIIHAHPDVDLSRTLDALELARARALMSAPAAACDCPTWKYDCPKCGGKRWLSGVLYLAAQPVVPEQSLSAFSASSPAASIPTPNEQRRAG